MSSGRWPGTLDHRLHTDIRQFGLDALALEILELMETTPAMTVAEMRRDLATLEALWRERYDLTLFY